MKHQEYDSPFEFVMSDITTQIARNIDEMSWNAVQRVGINVDKDKLLTALRQDNERYREAYANGYDTGYKKRDEEIVRCRDCRWGDCSRNGKGEEMIFCYNGDTGIEDGYLHEPDWFCAEGIEKDTNVPDEEDW